MAGGMDLGGGGKGGKKALDAPINLVPFLDLMAVTISFLLMTAVWTQIGRLQVAQSGGPSDPQKEEEKNPLPPVNLLLTETQLKLTVGGADWGVFPYERDEAKKNHLKLDKLAAKFKEIKGQWPEQGAITLQTEDAVRYEDLVTVIDECVGAGLQGVSVSPASG